MVICLEQGADLHTAQLMPLPLTVSCFNKIQSGFTFLVLAHLGSPGKVSLNVCECVCIRVLSSISLKNFLLAMFSGYFFEIGPFLGVVQANSFCNFSNTVCAVCLFDI